MSDSIDQALQRLSFKWTRDLEAIPRMFTSLLYPAWQQAQPSMTILCCQPADNLMRPVHLPAGSRFTATHPALRDLALQTLDTCTLLPLQMTALDYQPYLQGGRLSLHLQWFAGVNPAAIEGSEPLTFFLNSPWPDVSAVFQQLTAAVRIQWQTAAMISESKASLCHWSGLEMSKDVSFLVC